MFQIIFYETKDNRSELWEMLESASTILLQ